MNDPPPSTSRRRRNIKNKQPERKKKRRVKNDGDKEEEEDVPFWASDFIESGGSIDEKDEPLFNSKTIESEEDSALNAVKEEVEKIESKINGIELGDANIVNLNNDDHQSCAAGTTTCDAAANGGHDNGTKREEKEKKKRKRKKVNIGNDVLLSLSSELIIESSSSSSIGNGISPKQLFGPAETTLADSFAAASPTIGTAVVVLVVTLLIWKKSRKNDTVLSETGEEKEVSSTTIVDNDSTYPPTNQLQNKRDINDNDALRPQQLFADDDDINAAENDDRSTLIYGESASSLLSFSSAEQSSPTNNNRSPPSLTNESTSPEPLISTPLQSPTKNFNDEDAIILNSNLLSTPPSKSQVDVLAAPPKTPITTIKEYKEHVHSISKIIESTGLDRKESCKMANELTLKRIESDLVRVHQQEFEMWRMELDEKRRMQEQKDASLRHEEMVDLLRSSSRSMEYSLEEKIRDAYKQCKISCWKIIFGSHCFKSLFIAIIMRISRDNWTLMKRLFRSISDEDHSIFSEVTSVCKNEICGCTGESILDQQQGTIQSVSSYVYGTVSFLSYRAFDFLSPVMAPGWIFDGIDALSSFSCLGTCLLSWSLSILAIYLLHQVLALFRLPDLFHQFVNILAILPMLVNSWFVALACDLGCMNAFIALTSALMLCRFEYRRAKSRQEDGHVLTMEECDSVLSVYKDIGSWACYTSWVVALVIGAGLIPSPFSSVTIPSPFQL